MSIQESGSSPSLSLRLFGGCEIRWLGQLIRLRSDSDLALLVYLAVESDRTHARAAVAELLWPNHPAQRDNLRTTLAQVRKAIHNHEANPPFIPLQPRVLQFQRASDYWLDVEEFRLISSAIDLLPRTAEEYDRELVTRLRSEVELYGGRFLSGFSLGRSAPFELWRESKAEHFHRQIMDYLSALIAYSLHHERAEEAASYAARQIELMPDHEDAHRLLMQLYAAAGQRDRALAQYTALTQALAELDMAPSAASMALHDQILRGEVQPPRHGELATSVVTQTKRPLPWVGLPCLGRERERERIGQLLRHGDGRLVTLLGIGGIGKTRLALQVGEDCADAFPDGVFYVPLADVGGLNALVTATAVAVDFSFQEGGEPLGQLLKYLRNKRTLLILDNFEQLLMHRALITEWLAHTEALKLLVTSRERLGVSEEQSLLIEGLSYPPPGEDRWIETYPAVQLFIHCARLVEPDFYLSVENRADVAAICQAVAGMPLGIRLAAALTRIHSPHQLAVDLSQPLDFPQEALPDAPARQRNIRAVFEFSWRRLQEAEQVALCQLAIFRGGFTWEAAREVSDVEHGVLVALVDKSLVSRNTFDRFEIHELIRQHAEEKLRARPFAGETRQRHARYYLAFLTAHTSGNIKGGPFALKEISQEIENLRAGWLWSLQYGTKAEIGCYVDLLGQFYIGSHRYREAIELYSHMSKHSQRQDVILDAIDTYEFARWQRLLGEALYKMGEMQASRKHLIAALNALDLPLPQIGLGIATGVEVLRQVVYRMLPLQGLWQAVGYRQKVYLEAAQTYERLGQILYFANQREQAVYTAIRGLNLAEVCGPSPVLARLYANTCLGIATEPLLRKVAAMYGRMALTTAQAIGDEPSLGWALELVGMYRTGIGDWDEAQLLVERSIQVHERIGNLRQREEGLAVLAFIWQCQGKSEAALAAWRQAFDSAHQRGDRQVQMWSLSGIIENLMITGREERIAHALPGKVAEFGVMQGKPMDRMRVLLEQAKKHYDVIGDMAAQISACAFLALICLREQDEHHALAWARQALELVQTTSPMTYSNMDGYAAVAEVFLTLWAQAIKQNTVDADLAEFARLAQASCIALEKYAQAFPVAQPHALRWQGRRCWLLGQYYRAERLWQTGLRLAEQVGMPYVQAQTELELRHATGAKQPSDQRWDVQ